MAVITFNCPACKQVLKVSSEKAGRKIMCTKCSKNVTVPSGAEKAEEKPPAPPPPAVPDDDEEEVAGGAYGLAQEEAGAKGEVKSTEVKKEKRTRRKLKLKTVQYPELWEKVRIGLMILFVAVCVWGAGFAIQALVLLLGAFSGPQYASLMDKLLAQQQAAPIGQEQAIPRFDLAVGLIAGAENLELARTLLIFVQILSLFQTGIALTGYFFCLVVPNRYGTKGLAMTLCVLAAVNALLVVMFKLLPMTGMSNFVLWYFMMPEVSLMTPGMERVVPLAVFWAHMPFWEIFLGLMFTLCLFAEPIVFCLYLRACAMSLRDDLLQPKAMILVQLAFGQAFIMIAYQLLSLTGTSNVVIVYVLKATFLLWMGFFAWLLVWYGRMLLESRKTILTYLIATEEQAAEEEARDEGKDQKKVPAYLRGKDDDDEDDEEEDEEDEEEDDYD